MRRTALVRKTPLKPSGSLSKKHKEVKHKKARASAQAPSTKMLDSVWAEVVKLRAARECQLWRVGGVQCSTQMDAHHIIGRINYPTRWDLSNGVCLCAAHHWALHNKDTGLLTRACEEVQGEEVMQALREKNQGITKAPSKSMRVEIYAALLDERDRLRDAL